MVCALRFLYRISLKMDTAVECAGQPISDSVIQKACKHAARDAGLSKVVTVRTLPVELGSCRFNRDALR